MTSTLIASLLAWTALMISLYLAFNPWTLRSMEKPGPAQRLRQEVLVAGGFYRFHQIVVSSLEALLSRFVLMDEKIVHFNRSPNPHKIKPFRTKRIEQSPLNSSRLVTYLNVDAFETTFLLAQGYTTLSLFLSFVLSGKVALFGIAAPSSRQIAGSALSAVLWLLTSFVSMAIVATILREGANYRNRDDPPASDVFSGVVFEVFVLYLFIMLCFAMLALNQHNSIFMLSISITAIVLYGCSRSVLYAATIISIICQFIVFAISGWSIEGLLALGILWAALYKFARAHGMGPLLPTVQTRRFSWGYFISAHMAAPIFAFSISDAAGFYYSIMLVFVLLPLTNSLMDWLSIAITRYLMEKTKAGSIKILSIYLISDAALAILLFFVMLILVLTLFDFNNGLHSGLDKPILIPITSILDNLKTNPLSPEISWLTLMLSMTVIPTFLHYLIVWFSIGIWTTGQIIVMIDRRFGLRLWMNENSEEVNWDKLQAAASLHTAMLLTIVWFVGVGFLLALLALDILAGAGAQAVWSTVIDAAKDYSEWLQRKRTAA